MRITQSMLARNFLNNLNTSYSKLAKYQEQLASGKKINKLSDDPLSAMKGISYRRTVAQVKQYEDNFLEASTWIETTNDALDEANQVLQRIRELVVEGSTDTETPSDRQSIADEVEQLRDQLVDIANTKVNDKYIFNGTNTTEKPISTDISTFDGSTTLGINNNPVKIELSKGIYLQVNADGSKVFSDDLFKDLNDLISDLNAGTSANGFDRYLDTIDAHIDNVLSELSQTGARSNRLDLMKERVSQQELTATEIMSNNEDVDIDQVYTDFSVASGAYTAALKVGAQVIQPTLLDFLK
ncbi:flagellar hook-associated protein 3 [Weizmannia acidilactici]|uniref:Flagellar hook-associated protein 3 n=1 Tax=Weizmannia acidilactici TaxID=2607726 RepID=A0A5J4JDX4_9BACI|nr:flagellar hook-associated protein FlgL [Weizmannia acidilactici]GER68775.1 flagellar hook-associated protein 3 [Weizmannia acidilactici]GER72940.1 flagellar hook-associated protein 3 [Weizmannia acidilactici]